MTTDRRARLLRFLAPWTAPGGGYEVRVGHLQLPVGVLSGDALEDLASRVVADFWAHRRRVRLNRPLHAAVALQADRGLSPEAMRFAAGMLGAGTASLQVPA